MTIYIAGALTNVRNQNIKKFYENIGATLEKMGHVCHVPHFHFDPIKYKEITPKDVYQGDYQMISQSDLVIAYVGQSSLGVGIEIEIAKNKKIDVILIYEKGKNVSRMARGNPAIKEEIIYTTEAGAIQKLEKLIKHISKLA
jgi:nucleoside 2-deoxyribosyltransferase